jgi:hypothetical protein
MKAPSRECACISWFRLPGGSCGVRDESLALRLAETSLFETVLTSGVSEGRVGGFSAAAGSVGCSQVAATCSFASRVRSVFAADGTAFCSGKVEQVEHAASDADSANAAGGFSAESDCSAASPFKHEPSNCSTTCGRQAATPCWRTSRRKPATRRITRWAWARRPAVGSSGRACSSGAGDSASSSTDSADSLASLPHRTSKCWSLLIVRTLMLPCPSV